MDRNELVLVSPSKDMEHEILQYKEEHFAFGDRQVHGSGGLAFYDSFDEWLNRIRFIREKSPENIVLTSTFFSRRVSDGKADRMRQDSSYPDRRAGKRRTYRLWYQAFRTRKRIRNTAAGALPGIRRTAEAETGDHRL